ncbi:MAG TPA: muconolactone Delta-isomerase family protein [Actinomycetota bacterium]|nr:muconolactone Delta-isomerase family protein [Actinomycetota bacterium]
MAIFLVLWRLELSLLSAEVVRAVVRMPEYAQPLEREGKVRARYHIVGGHGGAWIYDVASNEELEVLLARSPVYNYASFEVIPLAEMAALPAQPPQEPTG